MESPESEHYWDHMPVPLALGEVSAYARLSKLCLYVIQLSVRLGVVSVYGRCLLVEVRLYYSISRGQFGNWLLPINALKKP